MNVFHVRPRGFNVGNETISVAVRALLREAFDEPLNIVPIPAIVSEEEGSLSGLGPQTVHEINLYGQGVIIGGGNLYENGQLDVDAHALSRLAPPLLLCSLSYGRIYDRQRRLTERTDSMPDEVIRALGAKAMRSLARDDATLRHLHELGLDDARLGGCPSLLLSDLLAPSPSPEPATGGDVLVSIRHPQLMSIPLADQARVHASVRELVDALGAEGRGPVRLLCHDKRDLPFAAGFGDVEYVLPEDVFSYLGLLRRAALVVSFRLHAFVPCLSFGVPAVNISYDERSASLVRTLGLADWDVDFLGEDDVTAAVLDRARRPDDLAALVARARPGWEALEQTTRAAIGDFAQAVREYDTAA